MVEKAGRGLKEGKAIPLTDAYSSEAEGKRGCELLLHFHFHSDPPTSSSLFRLPAVLCCGGVMAAAAAATTYLTWNSKLPVKSLHRSPPFSCSPPRPHRSSAFSARAFRRSDLDNFAKRVASGEAWRDAWRSANNGFELFIFEARKTAERIDRRYSVSRRLTLWQNRPLIGRVTSTENSKLGSGGALSLSISAEIGRGCALSPLSASICVIFPLI